MLGMSFSTGGGGLAALGVICNNGSKARGETGLGSPVGDPFYVDYVSHELGHQFDGDHTFNGSTGSCSGNNRNGSTAYEPGSGSTIQAYAGICGAQNLQSNSDDYFHTISFDQIRNHTRTGSGSSCAVATATGNAAPDPDAGTGGFTIPAETPFELTGSATDANGDTLTYNWEQFDLGPAGAPSGSSPPFFRSWPATTSPTRIFPRLSDLLNNTTVIGENLPTVSDTLNFRMTVRDNRAGGGGVDYDTISFDVSADAGPFLVTSPNTAVTWAGGINHSVTWDVAGTASAPVSCANVDILLSTDGGQTFSTTLLTNTPNDGSQPTPIPNVATTTARIKVKCSDSIFFDVSNTNFTIEQAGDGFAIVSDPVSLEICDGDNAQYSINVQQIGAFNSVVSLTAPSAPGTATFVPASGGVPFNSTLTVSGAAPGDYSFDVIGIAGADEEMATVSLMVAEPPPSFSLLAPTNGATGVALTPSLSWQDNNATGYIVEVATDAAFNNVVVSTTVGTTSYTLPSALVATTTYYWRVTANNLCGSAESSTYSFTTAASSLVCGATESFESGIPADWTIITTQGTGWASTDGTFCGSGNLTVGANYASTGVAACADSDADGGVVNTYLCTPAINLSGYNNVDLDFTVNYQVYQTPGADDIFEVLVSTAAANGPYGAALFSKQSDYPDPNSETVVNNGSAETESLNAYLGEETAYICFHYTGDYDWYAHVDDVSLTCQTAPLAVEGVLTVGKTAPPFVLISVLLLLIGSGIVSLRYVVNR